MSQVIQKQGMATPNDWHRPASSEAHGLAGLFSSALFCLWLSTASLVVWVDFGHSPAEKVAVAREVPATVAAASAAAIKHD